MTDFDVIVVGSGISGGWAAKEFCEKGFKVLMVERGRMVTQADYVGEHKVPWDFPFRDVGSRSLVSQDYPVQRQTLRCEEGSQQFFVKDTDHPYNYDPAAPFAWVRGYQLGGRSLTWGRVAARWGDINFSENARDGHGIDWPIRYADLEKWYDHVEDFIGVAGQSEEDFAVLPVGKFLPPHPTTCIEDHVADALKARFAGRRLIPAPAAVLSRDHKGRQACHYCGPCQRGCSTRSYFSTQSSTLPAAQATGNLTVLTDSIVAGLDYDPATRRVSAVNVIDARTKARKRLTAKVVFLNASTIGTTQILLASKSEAFPRGLANSSGVLGHYLMDHVFGPRIQSRFAMFPDRAPIGNRPNGCYIPRYQNVEREDAPFLRGFAYQTASGREDWTRGNKLPGFGAAFKHNLATPGLWTFDLYGFGECLHYADNRVEIDERNLDPSGLPMLKISFKHGANEIAIARRMIEDGVEIATAAGAVDIHVSPELNPGGATIHEMGTARTGRDPTTSVLNAFNQAHDVANLFVTDGACMASTAAQNPSLTYMALTARAADHAAGLLKAGVF